MLCNDFSHIQVTSSAYVTKHHTLDEAKSPHAMIYTQGLVW